MPFPKTLSLARNFDLRLAPRRELALAEPLRFLPLLDLFARYHGQAKEKGQAKEGQAEEGQPEDERDPPPTSRATAAAKSGGASV